MTVDETIKERAKVYGAVHHSHKNIGLAWTALIQQHYGITLDHPISETLVQLMMVSFKVQRSSRVFHEDNYIDLVAYAKFAEHSQKNPGVPYEIQSLGSIVAQQSVEDDINAVMKKALPKRATICQCCGHVNEVEASTHHVTCAECSTRYHV